MRDKNIKLSEGAKYSKDYFRENISYQLFGINHLAKDNEIVIITGAKGSTYNDEWNEDKTEINYVGEGKNGDQVADKGGNKLILNSSKKGSEKVIHIFEAIVEEKSYQYLGIFHLIMPPFYRHSFGVDKKRRKEIVFPLGKTNRYKIIESNEFIDSIEEQTIINKVYADSNLTSTTKKAIVDARKGQGKYKKNLIKVEKKCRFSGVTDSTYLIASHIKPWKNSNNQERLDGNNGLLLAPNFDKLFDKGFISIEDNGNLIFSEDLSDEVFDLWELNKYKNLGEFNIEQKKYLKYHRRYVFEKFKRNS